MSAIEFTLTDAGLAAAVAAEAVGAQISIEEFALGSGRQIPDKALTAVQNEIKRLPIVPGAATGANVANLTALDQTADAYSVTEIGIMLSDGTLFAYQSPPTGSISDKASTTVFSIAFDLVLTGLPAGSVTVSGNTGFQLPSATELIPGIIELATVGEVQTGSDTSRAVTAAGLKACTATTTRRGVVEAATAAEMTAGTTSRFPDASTLKAWADAAFAAASHNHSAAGITSGTLNLARLPALPASQVTSGAFAVDRIPGLDAGKTTSGIFSTARIPNLAASKINSGTLASTRLPAASETAIGAVEKATAAEMSAGSIGKYPDAERIKAYVSATFALLAHSHSAANITSGTLASARLPAASETAIGAVEKATAAEMAAGTVGKYPDTERVRTYVSANYSLAGHNHDGIYSPVGHTHGYAGAVHSHSADDITSGILNVARLPNLDAAKTTSGVFSTARIPNLPASKITSGTLASARLPAASETAMGAVEKATAAEMSAGTIGKYPDAERIKTYVTATFALSGHNHDGIYALASHTHNYAAASHNHSASNITSGTLAAARLPAATTTAKGVVEEATASEMTAGSGAKFPDCATVKTYVTATFALTGHNHDGAYAPLSHTHNYAAASHNHSAANITSGTLAAARLPAATTTAKGVVEEATAAEMTAGSEAKIPDCATIKTWADSRFVQGSGLVEDIRLVPGLTVGSAGDLDVNVAPGHVVTGYFRLDGTSPISSLYSKAIQKKIGGVWTTVSG